MPIPSVRSFVGIAKETTKGTGVTPADYIPIANDIKPVDKVLYIDDDGIRGSMVDIYNTIQGPIYSELSMGGIVFPDTFGYVLAAITGDVATTGASAPYTHTMAVKNGTDGQPKAYTLTDFYGISQARQYAGCQCTDLDLKFSAEGVLTYSSKWTGFQSSLVTTPTNSYTTVPPTPAWKGTMTIAGASKTYLMDGTLSLRRPVSVIHTIDGSQAPYAIWVGPLSVTGNVTFVHEDDTELVRYLTNTQPAFVLDFQNQPGGAATLNQVKVTMTNCAYKEGSVDRGKDFVSSSYSLAGIANTTDVGATGGYSVAKCVIQSAKAASTYV